MTLPDYKEVTPGQINVLTILTNLRMKIRVTNCVLVAFFILLGILIVQIFWLKSSWQDKTIVGAVDGVLGYTMYPLVKHYLPAVQNAKKAEENEKKNRAKTKTSRNPKKDSA